MNHLAFARTLFGRATGDVSCAARPRYFARGFFGLLLGLGALGPSAGHAAIITVGDTGITGTTFFVGNTIPGVNTLTVNGGSVLDSAAGFGAFTSLQIGNAAGVSGTATVTGAGSKIITTGSGPTPPTTPGIFVGGFGGGSGTLNVLNGGSAMVNRFDTTQGPGGSSSVKVDGPGSNITSASTFNIGATGMGPAGLPTATAEITNGGVVNAQTGGAGLGNGSNGKLTVSGIGSALNLVTGAATAFGRAFLNVGREQKGQLDILAGAKVLIDAAPLPDASFAGMNIGGGGGALSPGGSFANGDGTLNIDGVGSELRIKQARPLSNIGRQGTALVNITNGGKLIVENSANPANSFVGRNVGATGTVNVIGAGSEWQTGRRLFIGSDAVGGVPTPGGTGTVNVAAGGTVMAAGPETNAIHIGTGGTLTGGGGTVVGNVTNEGAIKPGNSPGIMNVLGNVTLNPAGMVEIELGGTNIALMQYDQLNAFDNPATLPIEGNITVGGNVNVTLFGGFNPGASSFFDVFTALDIMEVSPTYNLPAVSPGLHWEHAIVGIGNGREALRLQVVASTPEPGSLALLALGMGTLFFARRRRIS